MTCCWPEAATGWKVGDFNYLVVAITPDSDTNLYVQFWSEPQEPVLNEVCSGAWCPGAIRYIGPTERSALEARGYTVGGRAHNYSRRLVIDSAAKAEAAALETLQVMFDIFGYRGQWPLQIERHHGERAEHDPVVTSLTPQDFAKLAAAAGFSTSIPESKDGPVVVLLERGRQRIAATLVCRLPNQGLYSAIVLRAPVRVRRTISDAVLAAINGSMRFVKLRGVHHGTLTVEMPLSFDGGVTMKWVVRSQEGGSCAVGGLLRLVMQPDARCGA
jgi:hypothetical protein